MTFQEETGITMLQQEKNIRTQVGALLKEKAQRMQQLKDLLEQDQDLCDILCSAPYGIQPDSVPTPEQLQSFSQHIANQNAEKVGARFAVDLGSCFFPLKLGHSEGYLRIGVNRRTSFTERLRH